MERTFDIMFDDLVPETQKEVLKFLGLKSPEEANLFTFPLTEISPEDVEDIQEEARIEAKKRLKR